jgi:hypothetical protein
MPNAQQPVTRPFDAARAVFYGQFVKAAYSMYGSAPSNPTPTPAVLPAGYNFVAWVQMRDFVIEEGNWTFYGLMAQHASSTNEFILAIRGTADMTEWWDDLTSIVSVPLTGFGEVAYGFQRIYQTLRIVDYSPPETPGAKVPARSLEAEGTFADQVAAAAQHHAAISAPPSESAAPPATMSIEVTGHSLGSALATLYVAENSKSAKVTTPLLCTFASPRVGDLEFKTKFDGFGITSWRIVNELDLVPKLPFLGFWHVETEYLYNSGSSVEWSVDCWHSLNTYLHLLDPKQPLSPGCQLMQKPSATASLHPSARPARAAAVLSAPAQKEITLAVPSDRPTTINITITVEPTD